VEHLVFVNGWYSDALSSIGELPTACGCRAWPTRLNADGRLLETHLGRLRADRGSPSPRSTRHRFEMGARLSPAADLATHAPDVHHDRRRGA
jgi:hypothetical protein